LAWASAQPQWELKLVTVLFTDVVDSTKLGARLEPETFHAVLTRFFEEASRVLHGRGGRVQKYIGDAVMAVFGVPKLLGDDALRAVRAAVDLRDAMARLNDELDRAWGVHLELHTAVNTGEVVVTERSSGEMAAGANTFNVGARLLETAPAGAILLGHTTYQLVRNAVTVRPSSLSSLGDDEDVRAFELLEFHEPSTLPRRVVSPLVGRERELALLHWAYEWAAAERTCFVVSLLGHAGIGKTRLIDEFAQRLEHRRADRDRPRILRGRCLPYGDAITYYAVQYMVRQAAGIRQATSREEALRRLDALVDGDQGLAARLAPFLGLPGTVAEAADTSRALHRALGLLAQRSPLVLIVDDMQWAEPPLLDFLEHLADALASAPILLVCAARSDDFNLRDWAGHIRNAASIVLRPLEPEETRELIDSRLVGGTVSPAVVTALGDAGEGYPLHVEELIEMLVEDRRLRLVDGEWTLTGDLAVLGTRLSVDAAFAARLDRLEEVERHVAMCAAVAGANFRVVDVNALLHDVDQQSILYALRSLVRKELLYAHPGAAPTLEAADESFSFRHARYRETAYHRITRGVQAELHERYADWLARTGDKSARTTERIGFHLRQAYLGLTELRGGETDTKAKQLAWRAGERYGQAGHLYILESFFPVDTATRALLYAVELLPDNSPVRLRALLDLADLRQTSDPDRAMRTYEEVLGTAGAVGDREAERHATIGRLELAWWLQKVKGDWSDDLRTIDRTIRELEQLGDHVLLAKAYRALARIHNTMGTSQEALDAASRAVEFASATGDRRLHASTVRLKCLILYWSPVPMEEVIRATQDAVDWARREGLYTVEADGLGILARAAAMQGKIAEARQLNEQAARIAQNLRDLFVLTVLFNSHGAVELLAGDPQAAEQTLRSGLAVLEPARGTGLGSMKLMVARALLLQDRDAEAEPFIEFVTENEVESQLDNQARWRMLRALVLARKGQLAAAKDLAWEGVERSERSQEPDTRAEALADLAEILRRAGKLAESRQAAERALALYDAKGNLAAARRIQRFIAALPG